MVTSLCLFSLTGLLIGKHLNQLLSVTQTLRLESRLCFLTRRLVKRSQQLRSQICLTTWILILRSSRPILAHTLLTVSSVQYWKSKESKVGLNHQKSHPLPQFNWQQQLWMFCFLELCLITVQVNQLTFTLMSFLLVTSKVLKVTRRWTVWLHLSSISGFGKLTAPKRKLLL